MARELHLVIRVEDADTRGSARLRRQHEGRLGEADLECECLHRLSVDAAGVREDGELVALERGVREDVDDDVAERRHRGTLSRGRA
jgi:hypothetical protein